MNKLKTKYYQNLLNIFDAHVHTRLVIKKHNNPYKSHVREFLKFLEDNNINKLKYAKPRVVLLYYEHLITRKKYRGEGTLSISTINSNLSSLRMFSDRMLHEGVITRGLHIPEGFRRDFSEDNAFVMTREVPTADEVLIIYNTCETPTEKAILSLSYGVGLRRMEIEELLDRDINFSKGFLFVSDSKKNKSRTVPISDFFKNELIEYTRYRLKTLRDSNRNTKQFMIDRRGKPLSGEKMNEILKKVIKRTKNEEIINKEMTLHNFRHGFATHLVDDGMTLEEAKKLVGHKYSTTTQIYTKKQKRKKYFEL